MTRLFLNLASEPRLALGSPIHLQFFRRDIAPRTGTTVMR